METSGILTFLSSSEGKDRIQRGIESFKRPTSKLIGLKYLAVAPPLPSNGNAVLILAILEEGSYIRSEYIKEFIEDLTDCMGKGMMSVLNSREMEELLKDDRLEKDTYNKLVNCSVRLNDLNVITEPDLKTQYATNCENYSRNKDAYNKLVDCNGNPGELNATTEADLKAQYTTKYKGHQN